MNNISTITHSALYEKPQSKLHSKRTTDMYYILNTNHFEPCRNQTMPHLLSQSEGAGYLKIKILQNTGKQNARCNKKLRRSKQIRGTDK
jgi:hypothetical protein